MFIIAFEGIDKAGKETLTKGLVKELTERGYSAAHMAFPRYETAVGQMIRDILHGKVEATPLELAKLFEVDRYNAQVEIERLENQGVQFLIMDRYVMSNLFARVNGSGVSQAELLWLQHGLRPADLHVIVDISIEESARRSQAFAEVDKFEKDYPMLQAVRDIYLHYADVGTYYDNGKVIVVNGEQPRETLLDETYHKVMSVIHEILAAHETVPSQ